MSNFERTPPPIYDEGSAKPSPQQVSPQPQQFPQQSYGGQPGHAPQHLQQSQAAAQNRAAAPNPERRARVLGIVLLLSGIGMFLCGLALVALLMLYVLLGTGHGSAEFTGLHVAQAIAGVVLGVGGLGVMVAGGWQLRRNSSVRHR